MIGCMRQLSVSLDTSGSRAENTRMKTCPLLDLLAVCALEEPLSNFLLLLLDHLPPVHSTEVHELEGVPDQSFFDFFVQPSVRVETGRVIDLRERGKECELIAASLLSNHIAL